jgi:hypothetical protein
LDSILILIYKSLSRLNSSVAFKSYFTFNSTPDFIPTP